MKKILNHHTLIYILMGTTVLICLVSILFSVFNLKINTTSSIPKGIYRLNTSDKSYGRNDYVLFCLSKNQAIKSSAINYLDNGECALGLSPIGKKIVAVHNDDVSISEHGIFVNQMQQIFTEPAKFDKELRCMNKFSLHRKLKQNEFTVISNKRDSFDSRYFGTIHKDQILGKIAPLFILKQE